MTTTCEPVFGTLVEPGWLAAHLGEPDLRVFDCTVRLTPTPEDPYRYETVHAHWGRGHVPGAGWIDIEREVSAPWLRSPLEFRMPTPEAFAEVMGDKGIGPDTRVVLYSAQHPMWAARVWWLLRAHGHDRAAILDGGWEGWVAAGLPVSDDPFEASPTRFVTRPRDGLLVDSATVRAALADPSTLLVNGLSKRQHAGQGPHYGRPGRIPGSRCVPASHLVDRATGRFIDASAMHALFEADGPFAGRRVVTYCGSGIAASSLAFALTRLGHRDVSVYDGSLVEWSADPDLPMESD
jgi:thiosulfate/3-mercaptopyruvate sulfurtransferase